MIYKVNPNITVIGEYVDMSKKTLTKCNICGFEWSPTAQRLLRGHGCRKCAFRARNEKYPAPKRKTPTEFRAQMQSINPQIIIIDDYINARTKLKCECLKCGNIWSATPYNLESGCGCPQCKIELIANKQKKSQDDFVKELSYINKEIEVMGTYLHNKHKIGLRCKRCGCEWEAMPINLLRKDGLATGCPYCKESHGEKHIRNWLESNQIDYIPQKKFNDLIGIGGGLLSYDFYIPFYNTLIEYQGEFHDNTARIQTEDSYKVQVEHDKRKFDYAINNGYNLLPIWYYDDIEEKLNEMTLCNIVDPVTITVA